MLGAGLALLHQIMTQHQHIHAGPQEAIEGFSWPVHDGFILVERGVEEYWDARQRCKRLEELPVAGIGLPVHSLQPSRAVHMCHCRNHGTFIRPYRVHLDHEWIRHGSDKVVMDCLLQDCRSKKAKFFTKLDLRINNLPHVRTSGVGEYTPTPQGADPP